LEPSRRSLKQENGSVALWQLVQAIRRHAVIVVVCVAATLAALLIMQSRPGLYQAQTDIVLLAPDSSAGGNPFWGRDYSLIAVAGLLTKIVNQDSGEAQTVSSSVTLAGQGETDGYAVRLPNRGGQWGNDYDRPILDVQAVGRTPDEAQENLNTAVTALETALTRLQDGANVPTDRRMTLYFEETPEPSYGQGRPSRALAATIILGLGGMVAAVLVADDPRTQHRLAKSRARLRFRRTTRAATESNLVVGAHRRGHRPQGGTAATSARLDKELSV